MKMKVAWFAVLCFLVSPLAAQDPSVITMDQEPHHHLSLQNEYVKVFNVEVAPGDSIILHRHDQDTVAIAIGEQLVTVGIPGKPDVHQKNADAQVRLQRGGYVHSTRVDGDTPYHTVAVELLHPQTGFHNVCAAILPGQPLSCPDPPARASTVYMSQPLIESAETSVNLVHVLPHQSMVLNSFPVARDSTTVIVALDAASITWPTSNESAKTLQPGDFIWLDDGPWHDRLYQNSGDKEVRFIAIVFPRAH
jgi:quercetin dioxygenase-like cupin family protein